MKNQDLPPQLTSLRYPGDLADATTLLNDYGAAETIANIERDCRLDGRQPWDESLADSIPLSPALTPGIHALVSDSCARLGLACSIHLFTIPTSQINAFGFLDRTPDRPILSLCFTTRALEHLSDSELLFLIGHELGHIAYEHDRLNLLCHTAGSNPAFTVLPAMGEWLFLRWRQKAEMSADRIGWFIAGHFDDGVGAVIKSATGLSSKILTLNATSLQAFLNEDTPRSYIRDLNRKNAPLLHARLQALRFLEDSAPSNLNFGKKQPTWIQKVDKEVSEILDSLSRHPDTTVGLASMNLLADAGVQLIQGDKTADADEIKKVLNILHEQFTDEPDKVICIDPAKRAVRLKSAIRDLNRSATSAEKKDILCRLADIAISDGPFREQESKIIIDMATNLKIPQHEIYAIIVGCIQESGKDVDPGIQSLADKLASPAAGMQGSV